MDDRELDAIRERWTKREGDPRFTYQSGCAGSIQRGGAMHYGSCGEGPHHHHDDRCAPSPSEDVLALISELDRLRPKAEAWERLENELRLMQEIAGTPLTDRTPAGTISALGIEPKCAVVVGIGNHRCGHTEARHIDGECLDCFCEASADDNAAAGRRYQHEYSSDRETLARMEAPIQRFVSRELMEATETPDGGRCLLCHEPKIYHRHTKGGLWTSASELTPHPFTTSPHDLGRCMCRLCRERRIALAAKPEEEWRSDPIGPNPDYAPATCQCYRCRKDRGELATPQEGE